VACHIDTRGESLFSVTSAKLFRDCRSVQHFANKNKLLFVVAIVVVVVVVTFIVATKQPTTMENSTPLEDDSTCSLNVIVTPPNDGHATALSLASEFDTDVPRRLFRPRNNNSMDPNDNIFNDAFIKA
jgi:hypothetical protein